MTFFDRHCEISGGTGVKRTPRGIRLLHVGVYGCMHTSMKLRLIKTLAIGKYIHVHPQES